MRDMNIRIGGPRDQASQSVSFNVARDQNAEGGPSEAVLNQLAELRSALNEIALPPDDAVRSERALQTIEQEVQSGTPELDELEHSIRSVGRIVAGFRAIAPAVFELFQRLAKGLGFSVL